MSRQPTLLAAFQSTLSHHLKPKSQLLLALSGGLDSIVLLHLLSHSRHFIPFELSALHVHHGLSSNANAWAKFCVEQCMALNVPVQLAHVQVDGADKAGIEAAARRLRYQALFDAQPNGVKPDFVVTAHHQDDQAETLLIQLFRGAGAKGLASMALIDASKRLFRPLIQVSRARLLDYAQQQGLVWCEDESNQNTDYERNFVRHEVLPLIELRHQSVKSVLARTASHLAEASAMLDELAQLDAAKLIGQDNALNLAELALIKTARAKNLVRWWLAQNGLMMPSEVHLAQIVQQLLTAKQDANIDIVIQHLRLKRYQQYAYLVNIKHAKPFSIMWNGEPQLNLPNGSILYFKQILGRGFAFKSIPTQLTVCNRAGGEFFKPLANRPTRTLKYLLQQAGIPPWQRDCLPLIYNQNELVIVPKVGVSHEHEAKECELGLVVEWQY
jgi:tRNA(Ile)-lysidine synthase